MRQGFASPDASPEDHGQPRALHQTGDLIAGSGIEIAALDIHQRKVGGFAALRITSLYVQSPLQVLTT